MTGNETEKKLVLEMLADGKISVEEAQRLLDKLQAIGTQGDVGDDPLEVRPTPRHVRIVSSDEQGSEELNLRIPIGLVRAGLTLESYLPSWATSIVVVGDSITTLDPDYLRENLDDLDMTFDSDDGSALHIFTE